MVALKPLLVALSLGIASASAGPCLASTTSTTSTPGPTTPPSTAICGIRGGTPIDMNTGHPPTFLDRTNTANQAECLHLCRQESQCLLVGFADDANTCLLLAGTPEEAYFYETTLSNTVFFEKSCLGE
ncbi:hypothetical protein B0T10DRAFT_585847 [Thelonectria olida]|uniref:Apple domain-containing protein n=1 Tax=Thelonectria olida TaxID=1576542 RepID=A0A9P9AG10_9HYPO|nr:hypothetical protein B0T10DRAFT_585847 [Thelonectria olida]